jgi:hypothetical protein
LTACETALFADAKHTEILKSAVIFETMYFSNAYKN